MIVDLIHWFLALEPWQQFMWLYCPLLIVAWILALLFRRQSQPPRRRPEQRREVICARPHRSAARPYLKCFGNDRWA